MGRNKKPEKPDNENYVEEVWTDEALPPRLNDDGTDNLRYYQIKLSNLIGYDVFLQRTTGKGINNFEARKSGILAEAKMIAGYSHRDLTDSRSSEERTIDAVNRLLDAPEALWELTEQTAKDLEKSVTDAVEGAQKYLDAKIDHIETEADLYRKRVAAGKAWLRRLQRAGRLRRAAKEKRPRFEKIERTYWPERKISGEAWEATRTLRLMLWVYRSDISDSDTLVYEIAAHHCKMACDDWMAVEGVKFYAKGQQVEVYARPDIFTLEGGAKRRAYECGGIIHMCPPRHGKSTFGTAAMVGDIDDDPRLQCLMGHAQGDKAAQNMRHVSAAFKRDNAIGRRNLALFPEHSLDKRDNTQVSMRLWNAEPTRDPTLRGLGLKAEIGGGNCDKLWLDDPVSPDESQEPTERERTSHRMGGQWLQRLQGPRSFLRITATPWHPDDAVWRLVEKARGNKVNYAVSIQSCGGPEAKNGKGVFEPLWSRYGKSYLRQRFAQLNNAHDYACQFQIDPSGEKSKIIKQVALYCAGVAECPDPPKHMLEEYRRHIEFVRTCEHHLSIDPAATSKEKILAAASEGKKLRPDKAGLVHCGVGDVQLRQITPDGAETVSAMRRVRVLHCDTFYTGATELTMVIADYCRMGAKVDKIHIESVGFSGMIAESLRDKFGLSVSQVVESKPQQNSGESKRLRLKDVSPMIEDSMRSIGLAGAVVEFPGILNDQGELVPDPKYKWLIDQFLNYGLTRDDHGVDALVQLLKYVGPTMDLGGGEVSSIIRAAPKSHEQRTRERWRGEYESAKAPKLGQSPYALDVWSVVCADLN